MDVTPAEWPEEFVYVCSATKAAIINMAPVVHAGRTRIKRAVIFVGAHNPPTDNDENEATHWATELQDWLQSLQIPTELVNGPPDDPEVWARALRSCVTAAEAENLPVIFNAAGGRTQMKLGALWPPAPDVKVLVAEGTPLRTGFIEAQSDLPVFRRAIRHGGLWLSDYLRCHRISEYNPVARARIEAFFRLHESAINNFSDFVMNNRDRFVAQNINNHIQALSRIGGIAKIPLVLRTDSSAFNAIALLKDLPGMSITEVPRSSVEIKISDQMTVRILCGVWLEGMLFNRLKSIVGEDGWVAANICLQDRLDVASEQENWGEADIALLIHDQLHVIEAKTVAFRARGPAALAAKAARDKVLDQAQKFKSRLLGNLGIMWVVNPLANPSDISPAYATRLGRSARLRVGPSAIDDLMSEVTNLLCA